MQVKLHGQDVRVGPESLFARAYPRSIPERFEGHQISRRSRAGRGNENSRPTPTDFLLTKFRGDGCSRRRRFTCICDSGSQEGPSTAASLHSQACHLHARDATDVESVFVRHVYMRRLRLALSGILRA